jgi:ketosteroid isomerase-like protein
MLVTYGDRMPIHAQIPAQTTNERTRAVVRAYVEALQRGDADALRASFAPEATWWVSGRLPVSGTWHGPDGILDGFLGAMLARLDAQAPVTQELTGLIADGETAVAEWTSRARSVRGQDYENHYAVVFTVRDDLVVEVREYMDTEVVREVLFAA